MSKQVPYTFDCVSVSSLNPITSGSACENIGRMNVGVFTRYGNRNGSYITDQYAEYLISTAIDKPVVGFFDRESQDWQGHVGPTLASGYGYVDHFVGWQPFTDTDGVEREYAVFSVVLFSDYFEEARHILGKAQSMELDPNTIEGDWAEIDEQEYFVYTTGKMAGFCILGDSKEPCFSASAFFEKEDSGKTQFEKFSSLLFELKAKVEKIVNDIDQDFSIHDFRIVKGERRTNVLFDVAIPYETTLTKEQIKEQIDIAIKQIDPCYQLVITIEYSL